MAEKVVIGSAELWHGDCREVLPLLPAFDLVLTDPPYGVLMNGNPGRRAKLTEQIEGDATVPDVAWMTAHKAIVWAAPPSVCPARPGGLFWISATLKCRSTRKPSLHGPTWCGRFGTTARLTTGSCVNATAGFTRHRSRPA